MLRGQEAVAKARETWLCAGICGIIQGSKPVSHFFHRHR